MTGSIPAPQKTGAGSSAGRALLIVNQQSRGGKDLAEQAMRALEKAGIDFEHRVPVDRGDISRLIRAGKGRVDRVLVGGGDGTMNAAAPGLVDTGLPLGIVPLGTANDLARTLDIPFDLDGAAQVIAAGHTRRIDLGEVNGHPYFNVASLGLGVDLTRALTRDAKQRWGALGYAVAGLRVLNRLRAFTADIDSDGQKQRSRTVHLAVGNGRHYGGGMTVSEDASLEDGLLDVYSLEVESVWRLLRLLPALRSGHTKPWTEIRALTGRQIDVRTRRSRSVNADGEIVTRTPASFRVLPGAVRVFAP